MDKEMKAPPCSTSADPQAGPHVAPQETEAPPHTSTSAAAQAPPALVRTKRQKEEDTLEEPPQKRSTVKDAPQPNSKPSPQPSTLAPQMCMEETEALPHSSSSAPADQQVGPHMAAPIEDSRGQDGEQDNWSRSLEENRFSQNNSFLPDRHPSPRGPSPEGEDEVIYLDDVMNLPLWPDPAQSQPDLFWFLSWSPYLREM